MTGTASANAATSKTDLKQVKQYLQNIDPNKVEKVYGIGQYSAWHGDSKSQSQTNITFQTKSQKGSKGPPKYITIVARKKQSDAYVTYESTSWDDETAKTIIDTMIKALDNALGK